MKVEFLGSGTSTGVPQIGCGCAACTSTDPHDSRLRASVMVHLDNGHALLIDCGPDFRQQIIRAGAPPLDALLITHSHYDHIGGIDDLRPYCSGGRHFPTYCRSDVAADLRSRNPWSFAEKLYPGVPTFAITEIEAYRPIMIADTEVLPVEVIHGKLPITGYRIGSMAYITDCSDMPQATVEALQGVDTLVLNALRHEPHMSHFNLREALQAAEAVGARRTYFTHISHDMGPQASLRLPEGISLAHDGLIIDVL